MSAQIYTKKASEIIKESIKSAIYIDEKGWNPFENAFDGAINEHEISRDLYKNFKNAGISLNVHKFNLGEENLPLDHATTKYLFNDKDLVLLDWDLDEKETDDNRLNIPALKLLNSIIAQPQLHFCAIYSSTPDFEGIVKKIYSYFSKFSESEYDEIKGLVEDNEEILELLKGIDIIDPPKALIGKINGIDNTIIKNVQTITRNIFADCIRDLAIAADSALPKAAQKSNYNVEIMSLVGAEYTLMINNTIVTILKKKDNKPKVFIDNFTKHISKDRSKSFFKLLGLDMQNEFAKKGAFIDANILDISFNTFLHHRKQINKDIDKAHFETFMKNILIENAKISLNSSKLSILDDGFLDKFRPIKKNLNKKDIAAINSFYNGTKIAGNRQVSFGDVFIDDDKNYHLCITALCDCEHPENTNHRFYFAKNSEIMQINKAILLGDTGFISYLDREICIKWSTSENFVKPVQYHVPNNTIIEDKLTCLDWKNGEKKEHILTYVFTLKQNYAQRIANQAFSHPLRVGVDFAKI